MQKLIILTALMAGLLTFPIQLRAQLRGTTLVVNWRGHGSPTDCDASDPTPYRTIQAAVKSLGPPVPDPPDLNAPRRVILVCPGTYNTGDDGAGARVGIGINNVTIVSTHGPSVTK